MNLEGVEIEARAAVGAEALPFVGDGADVTRYDPVAAEGVRVVQTGVSVEARLAMGAWAAVRVEEGLAHAGGLEAAEARVGWARPWAGGWIGRADVPVTRDRELESDSLVLTTRPLLSRSALPLHMNGLGADAALPDRAELSVGAAWPTLTSDAPWVWARVRVTPFGLLPDDQDADTEELRLQVGAGVARVDSDLLGEQLLFGGDLAFRGGPFLVEGGWLRFANDTTVMQSWWAEAGARALRVHESDVWVHARGERVLGLGEEDRWMGTAQLAWHYGPFKAFVEAGLSRESAAPEGDVVVLPGAGERANDTVAVGILVRIR